MPINCGSQCMTCDFPIHFDTYIGCGHGCKYCFVRQKYDISNVVPIDTVKSLKNFINGGRNYETRWCDWKIPLHWGGNSDPFQPCELEHKKSLECLQILVDTQYPFIVSTKNPVMLTEEPYFSLVSKANMVFQISMGCSKYDKLEPGAPTYEERLQAARVLSPNVKRIIARVRPYFPDCHKEILAELPRYKEAGIYGISISSFVSKKKQKGMKRYGSTYLFPLEIIEPKFEEIHKACHDVGLRYFCSENDLDFTSDDLACCGTENLEGFVGNSFNIPHLSYDEIPPEPTAAMRGENTYQPFKGIGQSQEWAQRCKHKTFADLMLEIGEDRILSNREAKEEYSKE